jgi:hypothetical protein
VNAQADSGRSGVSSAPMHRRTLATLVALAFTATIGLACDNKSESKTETKTETKDAKGNTKTETKTEEKTETKKEEKKEGGW